MYLSFMNINTSVVCGFMNENGKIFKGEGFNDYIPILEELEFKATTDIKLIHGSDVCMNIDSYDERNSNKHLNLNVKKSKKLDVSINDINIGSTELVFNFTEMNIVVYDKYNIPHLCSPLDNKILKEKYRGEVIFITIHRLNNPSIVSDIYNNDKNYLKVLKESTKFKKNINNKYDEFNKVIEFADNSWNEIDYLSNDFRCNSIKVVTISSLGGDKLMPGNEESSSAIVITNKGLLVSRDTMFAYKENPNLHNDVDLSEFKKNMMPGTKFMYIIDNEDIISDRYHNHYGETIKVPKFKSKQQIMNGLYIVTIQNNFTLKVDKFYKIDEIDSIDFIYKTKEEAETGADKLALLNQEVKEKELTMQQNLLTAKEQYEITIHNLKRESEETKANYERKAREDELRFNELKRRLEQISISDKIHYDRRHYGIKNDYEERSYERDSFIEGLKTVGALGGIATTGFVIYRQLTKH